MADRVTPGSYGGAGASCKSNARASDHYKREGGAERSSSAYFSVGGEDGFATSLRGCMLSDHA